MRARRAVLLLALGLLLAPPAVAGETRGAAAAPPNGWASTLQRDHVLAGTIWFAREGRTVTRDALVEALSRRPIVLLGEVHDNPDHHRLRSGLISEMASRRLLSGEGGPAVVFEHIRADQQHVVDRALYARRATSTEALLDELEWERSGWPSAAMFAPLFEELLSRVLPILGGNTPARAIRDVARSGYSVLPDAERSRLGLNVQLEAPLRGALIAEIGASHCDLLPESAFAPMALAQQYRDAHLADVLLGAQKTHGAAVLLAGNGHVRADRGVPWHLRRRSPETGSVVVAFVEVDGGETDAAAYVPRDPAGQPAVDYVWLTPRAERPDPCERMRERFDSQKSRPPGSSNR